jgi:hypothetical protein
MRLNQAEETMNTPVPSPVAAYLAAERAKDTEVLGRCFGEAAVVRDEGREHHGPAAIRAWHRAANAKYRYVLEPLDASAGGPGGVVVRARVAGDFPGSPAVMRFNFTVSGDRIASLEVAP